MKKYLVLLSVAAAVCCQAQPVVVYQQGLIPSLIDGLGGLVYGRTYVVDSAPVCVQPQVAAPAPVVYQPQVAVVPQPVYASSVCVPAYSCYGGGYYYGSYYRAPYYYAPYRYYRRPGAYYRAPYHHYYHHRRFR